MSSLDSRSRAAIIAVAAGASLAVAILYLRRTQQATLDAVAQVAASEEGTQPAVVVEPTPVPLQAAVSPEEESAKAEKAEEARRAKERGNKRYQGKQYDLAIKEYSTAISLADPTDPEVAKYYGNRAQCHAFLDHHDDAETDCDKALEIDPTYVKALVRRATAREKLGKCEQAIMDYTAALLLSDMQHETATHGVDRLVKQVAKTKTEAQLKKPMRCLPSASFITTFVDSFRHHRELVRAPRASPQELTKSLAAAPSGAKRAALLVQRGLAHMCAREYEEAMVDWAAAVALISPLGDIDGGASSSTEEQRKSTLTQWTASTDGPPPQLAIAMLGMFLHLRGNYDAAMQCYDRALEIDPKAAYVLIKRSSLWFEKEQLPKSFSDFDAAIAIDVKLADVYCHRGQLHMLQQDLQKALTDLKKSVKLDGNSVLARLQLGMAHHRLKQMAEARAVFQEAEAKFPDSPDAHNYHGEFLVETGDLAGAADKFRKALDVSGGKFAIAYVNLGVLKLQPTNGSQPDLEAAIALVKQAIDADGLCETAHVHMAHLMLQKSEWAVAIESFDAALALLRVKQEVEETFAMREAAAAQQALLTAQPEIYKPAMERQRAAMANMG